MAENKAIELGALIHWRSDDAFRGAHLFNIEHSKANAGSAAAAPAILPRPRVFIFIEISSLRFTGGLS
jgi:hypothetical protein